MFYLIPPLIADHIFGKKLSLIDFQTQILPKILPATHTFSFTMMKYLKKFIGIKSVNRKQCPPPFYQKTAKLSGFINHSWISHTLQRGWGLGVLSNLRKIGGKFFSPKKERLLCYYESTWRLMLIFVFVNPRNITV